MKVATSLQHRMQQAEAAYESKPCQQCRLGVLVLMAWVLH